MALSPFVGQKLAAVVVKENHADMLVLSELIEAGKVTPVIDRTYPLDETRQAIAHVAAGHARGTVVISLALPSVGATAPTSTMSPATAS
jgi:NADPH:quinone reductase-like Zn-dependent oxidoreductase